MYKKKWDAVVFSGATGTVSNQLFDGVIVRQIKQQIPNVLGTLVLCSVLQEELFGMTDSLHIMAAVILIASLHKHPQLPGKQKLSLMRYWKHKHAKSYFSISTSLSFCYLAL